MTVTLSADPERTVEPSRITKTNQGGATAADYSGVPASVTFDAGDTSKTFDFAATQDNVDDDGESVLLAFGTSLPTGVTAGSPSETTVSIRDDDDPQVTVSFGAATYTAAEGGTATVTVTLSADPERTVEVRITTTNQGGATAADYSGVPATRHLQRRGHVQDLHFTATQDTVDDDGESVRLAFGTSLPAGVSAGSPSETTVSITDDDDPAVTVSFGAATYTAAEGGTATVTVTLSADPERTVAIPVTKTEQGGRAPPTTPACRPRSPSTPGRRRKPITFAATQDAEDDDGESVKLAFGALPTGVRAGATDETTVSITDDDDPAVTVSFGAATYTAAEGGTATVTVTLSADPERTVAIPVTKTNQGGASAADYSGVPTSVTFDAGDTSKTFDFAATQDAEDDDGESVDLAFGTSLPAGVSAGSPSETTVSITDDDDPQVTVSFGAATYRAIEGSTAAVTVELSADPERTVEVPITKTNERGVSDSDYSGVPASITFNSGDTEKTITFTATADSLNESGERVKLSFGTLPAGVSEGTPAETTVTISDSTQAQTTLPTIHFGGASYTVSEGGSVDVTVTLSKAPGSEAVIPLTASNQGGATASDYSGVPTSVTFGAAETSKTFTVTAAQDTVDDDGESILLGFGTLPGGITATTGQAAATTVSITDDDDPQVTVSFGAATLHGGGGEHGHGDGDAQRGPGADGGHPGDQDQPGRGDLCRLLRRAHQRHLRRRGHVQDLRLRSDGGHGGRRWGEREAGLRDEPAGRGQRGLSQRDHGEHHGRRRPAGDGELRGGDVPGDRGRHGHGHGGAERGPGADRRHPPHQGERGRGQRLRLLRGAGQHHVQLRRHREDDHVHGGPGQPERVGGAGEAVLRDAARQGQRGDSG